MPSTLEWINATLSAVGVVLAWGLAFAVYRANSDRRANRLLAGLLALQGALGVGLMLQLLETALSDATWTLLITNALLVANAASILLFCGTLGTPWTRPLRTRAGRALVILVGLGAASVDYVLLARGIPLQAGDTDMAPWVALGFASIAALVFTIDAYRRTQQGTPAHKRSLWFMLAFGSRDFVLGAAIALWSATEVGQLSPAWQSLAEVSAALALLLFVPLLAYGILSTQLFDVDLKIKVGISRGSVASFALAVVFVISKVVEVYASRTMGFVAGGVAAGLLMFAAPRLNKLGEKVANTAMPNVQPTSQYVAYKKLEVYRAAVESALEGDATIDSAERAMLDRLRVKLGLPEADANALEAELMGVSPS